MPLISVCLWYHSHTISHILWYLSLCHGTCAAGWRWLGAPGARCSTGSTVQLNCDSLDAVHGPVASAAALVTHCGRFVVIQKAGSPRPPLRAVQPMQAKRQCTAWAPDWDDIEASSMDSESNMDSTLKLARRVRQAVSAVDSSTWKFEPRVRVRTERDRLRGRDRMRCARRPPPPNYWGMFYYHGHHWRVLKCTICSISYLWQRIHDMVSSLNIFFLGAKSLWMAGQGHQKGKRRNTCYWLQCPKTADELLFSQVCLIQLFV
jgi:hypothetical protein